MEKLLGRDGEVARLEAAWSAAVRGEPQLVLLWGRRRVGKTFLASHFARTRRSVFFGATQQAESVELKRFAEAITMAYQRTHGVTTRIVRIFNTFGPRMRKEDGRVVPNFIAQALRGEAVTVYGDGGQTRSFCYVTDLVEGILRLLRSDYPTPVNIGNPREMTVLQFAKLIIELTGSKSRIVHKPLPVDDPKVRQPDITLARRVLDDWQPVVSVEEGLKRTIEYFQGRMREEA